MLSFLKKWYIFILLVCVAILGLWRLETSPGFWFDEGIIAGLGRSLVYDGVYGTKIAPGEFYTPNFWITTSYTVTLPIALSLKLFGLGIWQARLIPLLYFLGFIAVAYRVTLRLFGFKYAIWATLLLATFLPLYGNGRAVLGETPGIFWLLCGVLLYTQFESRKKSSLLFFSSFCWGLAVATKPFYALLVPGYIFILYSAYKSYGITIKQSVYALIYFAMPLLVWFYFAMGLAALIDLRGTFSYFLNSYAADEFQPAILQNLRRFFTEATPIHFFIASVTVFIVLLSKKRRELSVSKAIIALFIFIALGFLWYLKTPGWYRYFFSIHLIALLLFPRALYILLPRLAPLALSALVGVQVIYLFSHYNRFYSNEPTEVKNYLGERMDDTTVVFVASRPEIAFLLERGRIYQRVFISSRLAVGRDIVLQKEADYIVAGRDDGRFIGEHQEVLSRAYSIDAEIGHYRIYRLNH